LQKKKKENRWSTFNNFRMKYWQRMPPFWELLKVSRLQDLNIEKLPQKTRKNNGLSRRLKRSNKESTVGTLWSR